MPRPLAQSTLTSFVKVTSKRDAPDDEPSSSVPTRPSRRRRPVVFDSDDDLDEGAFPSPTGAASTARGREYATASTPNAVASATDMRSPHRALAASDAPESEMLMGDEDEVIAEVVAAMDAAPEADEEMDEEDEYFPGPDPNIAEEDVDAICNHDLSSDFELDDVEVNPDFARKLRIVLDGFCEWSKSISHSDFVATSEQDRPFTLGVWKLLQDVSVEFLLGLYLQAVPIEVQELFLKKEWCLEDLLSLPKVNEGDKHDQGLYGNFPTGNLAFASKIGCEAYVGSTGELLKRIIVHLEIARRHSANALPEHYRGSLHYKTTCRADVDCNFRKLAGFKRDIPQGYLVVLESAFMVFFGTYNDPGYYSKWATQSSYKLARDVRARLDVPAITWRGLNGAIPLRQGFVARGSKLPSECRNPECKLMTYPRSAMPDGPKHPRVLADIKNPLGGGYFCRRCDSYRERRGVLPDNASLVKLTTQYNLEVGKSNLRQAGQPVICYNCRSVEAASGAANSARGYGTRHIASNGHVRCSACDAYLRKFGRERDPACETARAFREQIKAHRNAGQPVRCAHCRKVEPSGLAKPWRCTKLAHLVCNWCYDHGHR
ncbi:uncharacterized protein J4E79_009717 [Alternaria viburni]|uniref:uncharacterized protein n=1 Tax=Alternaria viburni TaxID=566460 RepID=UPI0020C1FF82|nr:uncharacterized protein J4E79_009717 [Alternaria viburni]KAI4649871.1 hypothetical protein J4E79_009717 [Alternaria viburni]